MDEFEGLSREQLQDKLTDFMANLKSTEDFDEDYLDRLLAACDRLDPIPEELLDAEAAWARFKKKFGFLFSDL